MMKRWMSLLTVLAMLLAWGTAGAEMYMGQLPPQEWAQRETLRVCAIDVERSDAILLTCGGESMLVDCSTMYHVGRVYAALDAQGVTSLKYLFSTHSDSDHIGGFIPMINQQRYELGDFLSPNQMSYRNAKTNDHQAVVGALRAKGMTYRVAQDMEVLTLGGASMEVLRCLKSAGPNARSACLHVTFGESSILLTGDADAMAMQDFAQKYRPEQLRSDIMKVPHHGIVSVPQQFFELVAPQFLFITNNDKEEGSVRERMRALAPDMPILYSGDGAVVMQTDGQDWYIWQEENW